MRTNYADNKFQPAAFMLSLAITLTIGVVASIFTRPEITGWYSTLNKPPFTPPNWLFPVAWTIIYIMIATAAYMVWKLRDTSATYQTAVIIYVVQLALNFSWSIVFFGLHQILYALIIIVALLVAIILNISWFNRFRKTAAWLLIPYLLWVSYATLLNISICILNN
ncbi:MAG: TspO/MBR family protein [Bacteroidota bacterium]